MTYNNMGCFYKSFGKLLDFLICGKGRRLASEVTVTRFPGISSSFVGVAAGLCMRWRAQHFKALHGFENEAPYGSAVPEESSENRGAVSSTDQPR